MLSDHESEVSTNGSPVGRTERWRRWSAVFAAAGLVVGGGFVWWAQVADAFSREPSVVGTATAGTLSGNVPLCYGPGPDLNLTPTLTVVAAQNGTTTASVTVPASVSAHTYRLTLPAGTYTVRAGAWPARVVDVPAGATTVADLPGGICL